MRSRRDVRDGSRGPVDQSSRSYIPASMFAAAFIACPIPVSYPCLPRFGIESQRHPRIAFDARYAHQATSSFLTAAPPLPAIAHGEWRRCRAYYSSYEPLWHPQLRPVNRLNEEMRVSLHERFGRR